MQPIAFVVVFAAFLSFSVGTTAAAPTARKIPCKTPEVATSCYWAHGRLGWGNGTPSFRLWKIGTKRVLGIYSGPSVDRWGLDSERPELPVNLEKQFAEFRDFLRIFGDFEVCPLEPEKEGVMQAACIESAKNIVVEKF